MKYMEIARKVFDEESDSILNLKNSLDYNFEQVIELILSIKGRLIITGMGKSGHVGAKMAATLASTGTPSFFVHPAEALHGDLGMITSDDVVIAISNSGESEEILKIIPSIKTRGISIVAISSNLDSTLVKYSDYFLNIGVTKEACPLNLAPTTSTTAAMALGDAIAISLMVGRGFKSEDFAMFHPGGSLGRKLLTRVKDVMRSNNLPIVSIDTSFNDVIDCITCGKLGVCLVCDNDKLCGIITDGDLRRALKEGCFSCKAKDIMTLKPKTISETSRLQDAEDLMLKYKIKELVVLDDKDSIVGIIQLYDIGVI